jgi:hypothetical protein
MAYTIQDDGRYHIPIVALGNRLQDNFGLTVREHSAFGGNSGGHSDNSHHDYDEALDITDWRSDVIDGVSWKERTKNLTNLLQGSGHEILGPGTAGHDEHVHIGNHGGIFKLDQNQYNYLFSGNSGGKNSTFLMNADPSTPSPVADQTVAPATTDYNQMSGAQMNAQYDKLRMAGDVFKAEDEGMKMHKAHMAKR